MSNTGTIDINVRHITRIEGHGNIKLRASDGKIEKLEWHVPEAPRFFEAMVRGRSYEDIQTIVCRICGICSYTHSLAALKAIEDAMDIEVSEQCEQLRILGNYGEQMESHALHVGYLVAPDLLGVKSVVPLVASHPEAVKTVIRLHRLGNQWMERIGGRRTHPVSFRPGGFGKWPTEQTLRELKKDIEDRIPDLKTLAEFVLSVAGKVPAFDRPTEYIALKAPGVYSFYQGAIASTDHEGVVPVQKFESVVNEYVDPRSTAKYCKWHRNEYAVGALARFNLSSEELKPLAASVAKQFGLAKGCCNPYLNSVAQLVEAVQVAEHAIEMIDALLTRGVKDEGLPKVTTKAGWGAGAVEAPRGILFHSYEFDKNGVCVRANNCIPTNQNHANIQADFEALVPTILDKPQDDIRQALEMLVRSYDPCISCSTHYLDVEFV